MKRMVNLNRLNLSAIALMALSLLSIVSGEAVIAQGKSPSYTILDIGALPGHLKNNSIAAAINASGQTVGASDILVTDASSPFAEHLYVHAFRTLPDAAIAPAGNDLGVIFNPLGVGKNSLATSINTAGDTVGYGDFLYGAAYVDHAFLFDIYGMHDLGTFEPGAYSHAYDLNSVKHVVGEAGSSAFLAGHAVIWFPGHPFPIPHPYDLNHLLPAGSGWVLASAHGINDSGEIVGIGSDLSVSTVPHGFSLSLGSGKLTDLGTLGGPMSGADGLNAFGTVVGFSDTSIFRHLPLPPTIGFVQHAFAWDPTGMHDLGTPYPPMPYPFKDTLTGYPYFLYHDPLSKAELHCYAHRINSSGAVVGHSKLYTSHGVLVRAFLFDGKKMTDLNDLLPAGSDWTLIGAAGINDKGQIVGAGIHKGIPRGFLMTPHG